MKRTACFFDILCFFAILTVLVQAAPAQDNEETGKPSILSVSGEGHLEVEPDQATLRLGVLEQATNAAQAQESVNRTARAILDAVRKVGIRKEHVQTAQLTLLPVYSPVSRGRDDQPRIVAYRATNTITILVWELRRVGPVIDAALKAGANRVEGVSFDLRDQTQARQKALALAVEQARHKAEAIARALGVRLVKVLQVEERSTGVVPYSQLSRGVMMEKATAPTPVSAGQVKVNAGVSIRYQIENPSRR